MIVDTFDRELGDIHGDLKKYRQVSPFAVSATEDGNEKWLKETAVRTYHDAGRQLVPAQQAAKPVRNEFPARFELVEPAPAVGR